MKLIFTSPVIKETWNEAHELRRNMKEMVAAFLWANGIHAIESKAVSVLWNYESHVWHVSVRGHVNLHTGDVVDHYVGNAMLLIVNGNTIKGASSGEQMLLVRLWDGTPVTRFVKNVRITIAPSD